jgi:hypothetical protein
MTIEDLKKEGLIIFEGITGSQAYGTATPDSDIDIKGVFMIPLDKILNYEYVDQVSDDKNDTTYFELGKFLKLLQTNNSTVLELLSLPEECILYKDPIFDHVINNSAKFISKICKMSFAGYAIDQIKKARGLNKKIVKKFEEKRKSVLEFCHVPIGTGSIPLISYLEKKGISQESCGLTNIPHMRYTNHVYVDWYGKYNYKGIVKDIDKSNDISLSSIPKGELPDFIMQFNKDGYSVYCREYREYWDWAEKRNQSRFNDNMLHGKGYDGKNLAHCHRLLDMAIEIGQGKGIIVKRNNREELLSIRRGEYDYDELIANANAKIALLDDVYEISSLPDTPNQNAANGLLLKMRIERYNLK